VAKGAHTLVLTVAIALIGALSTAATASPATVSQRASLTSLESGVLAQLNHIRTQHHLVPLRLSTRLNAAADSHSREMGVDGYFEHSSHDGTAFWRRISRWYGSAGYGMWSVGENLLWSSPDVDPAAALKLWMASPEHRANILNAGWREIGVSAVHVADAPGTFHDLPVTIITTDFGVRR
jgi:uncharacterized protein YkwD